MYNFIPTVAASLLLLALPLHAAESPAVQTAPETPQPQSIGTEAVSIKTRMRQASMLLRGDAAQADVNRAIEHYRVLAESGLAYAQYRLARIYLDGEHVTRDPEQAHAWLLRAAELGYIDAQLELSELYASGAGIDRNLVDAYKWLEIAESLGAPDLSERRQGLESEMSFFELTRARYQSRRCMYRGYENC